jgi:methyl coenzyme M reductase subunit C
MFLQTAGGDSMLMSETAPLIPSTQQEASSIPAEPTEEEQIEQIKLNMDWLNEIKDHIDEDIWLNLTTSLEEMLEELEAE